LAGSIVAIAWVYQIELDESSVPPSGM